MVRDKGGFIAVYLDVSMAGTVQLLSGLGCFIDYCCVVLLCCVTVSILPGIRVPCRLQRADCYFPYVETFCHGSR